MKICYALRWIILPFLFTPLLLAQNTITFDNQGWNPDQSLGTSFTANSFSFSGTRKFFTNYGYNFDVDSVSVFFLFGDKTNDHFSMSTPGTETFNLISLNVCQVSKQSTDSLVIEGWNGDAKVYSQSFAYDTLWTTLNLNYDNITKVIFKLDSTGNGGISDYNFDNIFYLMAVPVELVNFKGASEEDCIKLEWETVTETNNYGFNIERKDSSFNWQKIGFIKGQGSATVPNRYSFADKTVINGSKYIYRLKAIDLDGSYKYSKEIEITANLAPASYFLSQNYPNPFNPSTKIDYKLPQKSDVTIKVYNILGKEITTLVDENKEAGSYSVRFEGSSYPSGVYIYELRAGKFVTRAKMVLIK